MERVILCGAAAAVICGIIMLFAPAIKKLIKTAARTVTGFAALWLFNHAAAGAGISLGINLFNSAVIGIFGPAGLAMLLFLRWTGL